jgi:hypothetical protein
MFSQKNFNYSSGKNYKPDLQDLSIKKINSPPFDQIIDQISVQASDQKLNSGQDLLAKTPQGQ